MTVVQRQEASLKMTDKKFQHVEFAPGAFDGFEGTQEELDGMVVDIKRMFTSGEFEHTALEVDIDELIATDPDMAEKIFQALEDYNKTQRKLQ